MYSKERRKKGGRGGEGDVRGVGENGMVSY